MSRQNVSRGGLNRSVTVTVELADGEPFSFVAYNQENAAVRLAAMPDLPRRLLSLSTVDTVYADLIGSPRSAVIQPVLMACFEEPPLPPTGLGERERERLYSARRKVAAMRGEDA